MNQRDPVSALEKRALAIQDSVVSFTVVLKYLTETTKGGRTFVLRGFRAVSLSCW